jgi:hypothetical protein
MGLSLNQISPRANSGAPAATAAVVIQLGKLIPLTVDSCLLRPGVVRSPTPHLASLLTWDEQGNLSID